MPRVLRALRDSPLAIAVLQQRLPDLASTTLDKRVREALAAGRFRATEARRPASRPSIA